jgi:hypothetical protein
MVRPCQRISTSTSPEQASSGAMRWTSTVCHFLSGDTTLGAMHSTLPDFQGIDPWSCEEGLAARSKNADGRSYLTEI